MKLRKILILLVLMVLLAIPVAATPYLPSTSEEARCVPNYIYKNDTVQMLYNPDTAAMAIELSIAAYSIQDGYAESSDWLQAMHSYGYEQVYKIENNRALSLGLIPMPNNSTLSVDVQAVNGIVGIQKVYYNGQAKYAVGIAFRGTVPSETADLLTDAMIIPVEDGIHLGFLGNARDLSNNISETVVFDIDGKTVSLDAIIEDMKNPDSKYCMVVMGHSLGGAIADVFVGHELYGRGVHPSNVAAYTFAAPKSALGSYEYPYNNIFNVINNDDLIPCVGSEKQIGGVIGFEADDAFRQANYNKFEADHTSAWWRNIVNNISMGLSPHNRKVYRAIAREIEGNISDYVNYSTEGIQDITWADIYMRQDCYGSFSGSIDTYATIWFEGASLCVGGDLIQHDTISMHDRNDYLLVEGNWKLEPRMEDDAEHLTAGTVELRGNMDVEWLHGGRGYWETGSHRTFFTGDTHQAIRTGSTSHTQFENLYIKNPYVDFELAIRQLKLREDTKIVSTPNLRITDTLELNGYTLTVEHPVLNMTLGSENTLQGTMLISGSLLAEDTLTFDRAEVRITHDCELRESLIMQNEEDYLLVRGNFTVDTCEELSDDHLTAGTVEVKGNFTQSDPIMTGSDWYGYYATGTHKTILSGEKTQKVIFQNSTKYNQLENLIAENEKLNFGAFNRIRLAADATVTDTGEFVANGSLNLNGYTLHLTGSANIHVLEESGGVLEVEQDLHFRNTSVDGTVWVGGSLTADQPLIWNHASVEVEGDCTLGESLYMQHEDDALLVHGLLGVDCRTAEIPEDHLSAGMVELKGGFETLWHTERAYWETGSHETIFSGSDGQNIFIRGVSHCRFENLYLRNPKISFGSSVPNLILREDTTITATESFRLDRELNLNGHTLTLNHPEQTMTLGQAQTINGTLHISGDLLSEQKLTFAGSTMTVAGDCELRDSLVMRNKNDYLLVGGNLVLETRDNGTPDHLTAGTVEVKGNMTATYKEEYAYYATGSHRTVLSGTEKQTLSVAGEANRIENLICENPNAVISYMHHLGLGADLTLTGTNELSFATLDLKGCTLTTGGSVRLKNTLSQGTLAAKGDLFTDNCTIYGNATFGGNAEITGRLTFAGGSLCIGGNCKVDNGLVMQNKSDYLLVGGNFKLYTRESMAEDHLSAGTLEVKGNLNIYDGNQNNRSFQQSGIHQVILSGDREQVLWVSQSNEKACLTNLYLRNPYVNFSGYHHCLILREDTAILSTATLNLGTLDLNGYRLMFNGTLNAKNRITEDSAMVAVSVADGVVTAKGFAAEETPVHVLVTGYSAEGRLTVFEVLTFSGEQEMQEKLDTTLWTDCAEIKTMVVSEDYAPICPVFPVVRD